MVMQGEKIIMIKYPRGRYFEALVAFNYVRNGYHF